MEEMHSPTLTMFEEFSYTGQWWLPDEPNTKWKGTVSYRPGSGIVLKLSDEWRKSFVSPEDAPSDEPIILGEVSKSPNDASLSKVSLVKNKRQRWLTEFFPVLHVMHGGSFQSDYLVFGAHFHRHDEAVFESMDVTFSSLNGWLWLLRSSSSKPQLVQEMQLREIEAKLLFYKVTKQSETDSRHIGQPADFIRIVPNSPQQLIWFRKQIDSIRDLLSLLAGLPIETKCIRGSCAGMDPKPKSVDIYHFVQPQEIDETANIKMPFPLERLDNLTPDVFGTWFGLNEDKRVPYSLCLDVIYNMHKFWKFELLALAQALEVHHRLYYEIDGKKNERYRGMKGQVKKRGPDFIDRLTELLENLPENVHTGPAPDVDFLKSFVKTRNYYTHYNSKNRGKALKDLELYGAITCLVPFIGFFLYRKLNIPTEVVREAFKKTRYRGLWLRPAREFGGPDVLR